MELTVLGSGGNTPTPMPTCNCRVCVEAREKGVPYARRGNSLFVHEANVLIDAPELVWHSLNREGIEQVEYVFLTHFHADHTLGLRTIQALGMEEPPVTDFVGEPPTLVVSSRTHERAIESNEVFDHLTSHWADVQVVDDGESFSLGGLDVTHVAAEMEAGSEDRISGFLFEEGTTHTFVSPDENRHFELCRLPELDLWVKETGYFRTDPAGNPLVTEEAEENGLAHEMSFEESLEQVRAVRPERVIFTEIEELYRRSYDDYCQLESEYAHLNVEFAYDGMTVQV